MNNKNIIPGVLIGGAFLSALACTSRMDYNFPIFIFCFFIYTFDTVKKIL